MTSILYLFFFLFIGTYYDNSNNGRVFAMSREKEEATPEFQAMVDDEELSTVHLIEGHGLDRNIPIVADRTYEAHVTLYIDNRDGTRTKTGFSTHDSKSKKPFVFQLDKNLDTDGWHDGVGLMNVGERCEIKVPPKLGYGSKTVGTSSSKIQIPPNSWLIYDMHVLGEIPVAPKKFHKPKIEFIDTGDDNKIGDGTEKDDDQNDDNNDNDIVDETKKEL